MTWPRPLPPAAQTRSVSFLGLQAPNENRSDPGFFQISFAGFPRLPSREAWFPASPLASSPHCSPRAALGNSADAKRAGPGRLGPRPSALSELLGGAAPLGSPGAQCESRRQGPGAPVSGPEPRRAASGGRFNPPKAQLHLFMCFNVVNGQLNELQFVIFMVNLKSRSCWLILLVGGQTRGKSCRRRGGSNGHFT